MGLEVEEAEGGGVVLAVPDADGKSPSEAHQLRPSRTVLQIGKRGVLMCARSLAILGMADVTECLKNEKVGNKVTASMATSMVRWEQLRIVWRLGGLLWAWSSTKK